MNELIKITQNKVGQEVVSAKDLYIFLGLDKSQWSRWSKQNIVDNGFAIKNKDWVGFDILSNGNKSMDFALSIDFAKKISMMVKTEKGEIVRNYFVECENKLSKLPLPSYQIENPIERATAWIEEQKITIQLQERNNVLEPRSKYFEQMVLTDGLVSMEQASKLLNVPNMGRNNLYKALRLGGVIQKQNTSPFQHYITKGYFELKEEIIITKDIRKVIITTMVTQKGLAFLFKFFGLTDINN